MGTIAILEETRPLNRRAATVALLMGRAKRHPHQTQGMRDAVAVFEEWMTLHKKKVAEMKAAEKERKRKEKAESKKKKTNTSRSSSSTRSRAKRRPARKGATSSTRSSSGPTENLDGNGGSPTDTSNGDVHR
mmetsp:Transcript_30601/g.59897  ORF Transcript_30601/g.59897 Transcript_30601/m.59897 type:complete len:132 (-) Transcript_30601:29-424(-)